VSNRRIERPNSQFVSHASVIVGSSRVIAIGIGIGTGRNRTVGTVGTVGTVESPHRRHPLGPLRPLVFCPWILRSA
jgi:hypothetical protein